MNGTVKRMIDKIIAAKAASAAEMSIVRTKLMLKGIMPKDFTDSTPDDPAMIAKVRAAARDFGVVV